MRSIALLLFFVLAAEAATAAPSEDVRGIAPQRQGLKVIEEKCLACHNRQRIDAAVRERKDMAKILQAMEGKGVKLTEKDRMVIGHFWKQSPFREKGTTSFPK